ncbi:unnamed protein product [Psylliodes chrysocephalus]|uniref:VPS9 domain-containing protein n=1 Tax=Psylliodes chrysocephalus TaxID=3402493 RepID=A0A9P0D9U3_9CUCU|nr:unnamed protein product [Psylliodes chrysocephala]
MWSQYDENLSANPFFKEIHENHSDIIEESSIKSWIICVPRNGTLDASEVTADIILDHILVFSEECNDNHYFTLSKKQIKVEDKQLITDLNNSQTNVDILFEETFYVNGSTKFIAWCIDRPLFLKRKFCDSHSSKNLSNLHDCIDFMWCESLSHSILDSIKNLVNTFMTNYELEIENLQTQKEVIGCLFSQCLQICFKNDTLKEKCTLNSQFLDNLKVAVEAYMQYCLGRKLMFSINTVTHQKDGYLNKIIRNSSDIQYQHLGIENYFSDVILTAKSKLNQINSYWTILDKTECLKKTLSIIFESGKNVKSYITSDNVLQILVFLILKLNVNNWFSNLTYLKEFQFSIENSDQTEFCISSFEAALEFIRSSEFWDIKNNLHGHLESGEIAINFLEKHIKSGDTKTLASLPIMSKNEIDQDMCHPLCACINCQNIIQQKSDSFDSFIPFGEITQHFLIFAACLGKCEVLEFLLNRGVDINFSDCFGKTSLHYAASRGLQNVLLLLINRKANVNLTDNEKNTPLHLASLNGHENCAKALLYSSPDVELNIGNSFGDTPLILASRWGYCDIVKILLENGASVIVKNKRNQTVFEVAPNFYIVRLCEKYSARQYKKTDKIIEFSNISLVTSQQDNCKSHGIRPKSTDQFKKIELLLKSIENNDFPLTCFYLGYGNNNIQTVDGNKCHPLCVCDKCKNEQFDDYKDDNTHASINVNMCDASGYTPLHTAAKFGRTEILRLLLDSGALPNVKTFKTLYTPLHLACIEERIQIVRELLKCGECRVDEQDAKGNTPLYYTCAKGNTKIAEILLSNGADCNKKNFAGESALTHSEENMQFGIFRLLKNNAQSWLQKDTEVSSTNNLF